MKTETRTQLINYIIEKGSASPSELSIHFGISPQALHRHLLKLVQENKLEKRGSPPKTIYLPKQITTAYTKTSIPPSYSEEINEHFTYFSPTGERIDGLEGFLNFLNNTNQSSDILSRAKEYCEIKQKAETFRDKHGIIDGTQKITDTFKEVFMKKLYYSGFYSLPKFGKTLLGQLLLHGKSGQQIKLIREIANQTKPDLETIIKLHKIDAVAFLPHSIPRKIPFLDQYRKFLYLHLPEVKLFKAYKGTVPIAQKSLSKLSERVENARETIFIKDTNFQFKNILIIDDALGSGATLNETAKKFLRSKANIYGYAIVGSYKGFEVLKEV